MVIRIRTTKRRFYDDEGNELVGQCSFPTPRSMSIMISRRYNKTVNKYAGTLLHEMLHAWVNMLEMKGFTPDEAREEAFVQQVERIVVKRFHKKFKGRRP